MPANPYRIDSLFGGIFALAHHADKVAISYHHDKAGHAFGSGGIDLLGTGAIRRSAQDFTVKHAIDDDVLRILGLAGNPGQRIGARRVFAHENEVLGALGCRVFGDRQPDILALEKIGIGDSSAWFAAYEDVALAGCQADLVHRPVLGGESDERTPCRRGSPP